MREGASIEDAAGVVDQEEGLAVLVAIASLWGQLAEFLEVLRSAATEIIDELFSGLRYEYEAVRTFQFHLQLLCRYSSLAASKGAR